jgi:hypothetical protein
MKEPYFIVEQRGSNAKIENANCFLGSSINNVIYWINDNKDFDHRDHLWYWALKPI